MADRATAGKTPTQMFALVFGAVYLLVGLLGFINDPILGIFDVNALHNIVHLGVGAAWVFSSRDHATAKVVSLAIGVVYLLVAALGFVATDLTESLLDIGSDFSGTADNFLHLASGALGVFFGTRDATTGARTSTV